MRARAAGRQRCEGRGRGQARGVSWCEAMTAWLVHGQQIGSSNSSMFWQRQQPGCPAPASNWPSAAARRPMHRRQHECNTSSANATPILQMQQYSSTWLDQLHFRRLQLVQADRGARCRDDGMQGAAYNEDVKCERHTASAHALSARRPAALLPLVLPGQRPMRRGLAAASVPTDAQQAVGKQ